MHDILVLLLAERQHLLDFWQQSGVLFDPERERKFGSLVHKSSRSSHERRLNVFEEGLALNPKASSLLLSLMISYRRNNVARRARANGNTPPEFRAQLSEQGWQAPMLPLWTETAEPHVIARYWQAVDTLLDQGWGFGLATEPFDQTYSSADYIKWSDLERKIAKGAVCPLGRELSSPGNGNSTPLTLAPLEAPAALSVIKERFNDRLYRAFQYKDVARSMLWWKQPIINIPLEPSPTLDEIRQIKLYTELIAVALLSDRSDVHEYLSGYPGSTLRQALALNPHVSDEIKVAFLDDRSKRVALNVVRSLPLNLAEQVLQGRWANEIEILYALTKRDGISFAVFEHYVDQVLASGKLLDLSKIFDHPKADSRLRQRLVTLVPLKVLLRELEFTRVPDWLFEAIEMSDHLKLMEEAAAHPGYEAWAHRRSVTGQTALRNPYPQTSWINPATSPSERARGGSVLVRRHLARTTRDAKVWGKLASDRTLAVVYAAAQNPWFYDLALRHLLDSDLVARHFAFRCGTFDLPRGEPLSWSDEYALEQNPFRAPSPFAVGKKT